MKFLTTTLLLSVCFALNASAASADTAATKIKIVVVSCMQGRAERAETALIPNGTTLKALMEHGGYGLTIPTLSQQGFAELCRLPNFSRPRFTLDVTMQEVRRGTKADVKLEDGDLIIIDTEGDF